MLLMSLPLPSGNSAFWSPSSFVKATQPADVKQRLSKQRSLIMMTAGLTGKLSGLPWQEWSEDDRNDLANALLGIRSQVQDLLRDMNALPAEDQPVLPGKSNLV